MRVYLYMCTKHACMCMDDGEMPRRLRVNALGSGMGRMAIDTCEGTLLVILCE